jgi:hypothetical protein
MDVHLNKTSSRKAGDRHAYTNRFLNMYYEYMFIGTGFHTPCDPFPAF